MFLTYKSNTWLYRTTKAHTYSRKRKRSPLPVFCPRAPSAAGRLSLLAQASPLCLVGSVPVGSHSQGTGIPPGTLALSSGLQGDTRYSNLPCSISVGKAVKQRWPSQAIQALGKCRGRQQKEASHSAGEQDIFTQCNHLPLHQAQAMRGKHNSNTLLFSLEA